MDNDIVNLQEIVENKGNFEIRNQTVNSDYIIDIKSDPGMKRKIEESQGSSYLQGKPVAKVTISKGSGVETINVVDEGLTFQKKEILHG